MNDQQFDRLLKASLSWQADRAIDQQPRRLAMRRLSVRLGGPSAATSRPQIVMLPTPGTLNLIALLLLLLILIGGALLIGSLLLRDPLPRPGPFGFATACEVEMPVGVVIEAWTGERTTWLLESGTLITDESVQGSSYEETVLGSAYAEWSLNQHGIDLVLARVDEASFGPGCFWLRTEEAAGSLQITGEGTATAVTWGAVNDRPWPLVSAEAERTLVDLAAAIAHPETWLPDDAFAEAGQQSRSAQSWIITVSFAPTDLPPGARVHFANGLFLDGTDPRYHEIVLPGSQAPLDFGEPGPQGLFGPGTEMRCGLTDPDSALVLARSLDALDHTDDGSSPVHTPDMAYEVHIGLSPATLEGSDCTDLFAEMQGRPPSPAPPIQGDLAEVDPCSLIDRLDATEILGADGFQSEPSGLPIGRPALACAVYTSQGTMAPPRRSAIVTLYPNSVPQAEAGVIVEALFGPSAVQTVLAGQPAWENDCIATEEDCARAIAAWIDHRLLVFEFPRSTRLPDRPHTPPGVARAFVEATLEQLAK